MNKLWITLAGTIVIGFVYAGIAWNQIGVNADDIEENKNHPVSAARVVAVEKDISSIQKDIEEINDRAEKADEKLDDILDAVKD